MAGVDSHFSLEARGVPRAWSRRSETRQAMLGAAEFGPGLAEEGSAFVFRRSLYVVRDLEPGDRLTEANVRSDPARVRPFPALSRRDHRPEGCPRRAARHRRSPGISWRRLSVG